MKRILTLIYLVIVFHLPVWKSKKHFYTYFENLPKWKQNAIRLRNGFHPFNGEPHCFWWFKIGRFYIRNNYSYPMKSVFRYSNRHLFVWRKVNNA